MPRGTPAAPPRAEYVAGAPPVTVGRAEPVWDSRLLALLWPESDREHARTSLRNALHVLRRSLGEAVLVTRGDEEVGIAPGLVWCDAVAFDDAVAGGRLEDALALYRGDLLAGFFVDGVLEFERWVERERARLRQAAADAAGALAGQRADANDLAQAVSAARRVVELSESDERALRRPLELLERSGDRAGALEAYASFARALEAEYDAKPAESTRALMERIRAGSTDRSAGVETTTADTLPGGRGEVRASPSPARASRNQRRMFARVPRAAVRALGGLVTLGTIGGATAIGPTARDRNASDAVPLERRIAVLPFRNLSERTEDEFLAGGLHDAIHTHLSRIADLHVVSRQSVRAYADSNKGLRRIGQDLGVGTVIDGSVRRVAGRVRVTMQLMDARKDKLLWANQYERAGSEVFSLENDVTLAIAESLRVKLTPDERERLAQPPTRNVEAYTFFLKGREQAYRTPGPTRIGSQLGKAELYAAEELLRRAVAADSTFAVAHARPRRGARRDLLHRIRPHARPA